jgi:tRNA A-37 threonylcarbamoyl transferase component Bud32
MSTFSSEIWVRGLDTKQKSSTGRVYRLFNLGESTPSETDFPVLAYSKDSYDSSDESDSDDKFLEKQVEHIADSVKHHSIFSVGEDSSDYESDATDKSTSISGFLKDLLSRNRASPLPPDDHGLFNFSKLRTKRTASPPLPRNPSSASLKRTPSEKSLQEKYGKLERDCIGKGSFATIRLCCPQNSNVKYAVKEFRKRKKNESKRDYVKQLIEEFCISSTLENENVVKTVDLIKDNKSNWCVVMEYCSGGDLFAHLSKDNLTLKEKYCYFVQLVHGVQYLHKVGVSHRDLKPENLLLDATKRILKIADFGVSKVFRGPFECESKLVGGIAGSGPYIAPEVRGCNPGIYQ